MYTAIILPSPDRFEDGRHEAASEDLKQSIRDLLSYVRAWSIAIQRAEGVVDDSEQQLCEALVLLSLIWPEFGPLPAPTFTFDLSRFDPSLHRQRSDLILPECLELGKSLADARALLTRSIGMIVSYAYLCYGRASVLDSFLIRITLLDVARVIDRELGTRAFDYARIY